MSYLVFFVAVRGEWTIEGCIWGGVGEASKSMGKRGGAMAFSRWQVMVMHRQVGEP